MGYPNFGKVKTIVLPCPSDSLTIAQYKERYGIDLSNYLRLEDASIYFKAPENTLILLNDEGGQTTADFISRVNTISFIEKQEWEEGNTDGVLNFGAWYVPSENAYEGLSFVISKSEEFKLENLLIIAKVV